MNKIIFKDRKPFDPATGEFLPSVINKDWIHYQADTPEQWPPPSYTSPPHHQQLVIHWDELETTSNEFVFYTTNSTSATDTDTPDWGTEWILTSSSNSNQISWTDIATS